MITPDNVAEHELVGLDASVVGAPNPAIIGLNGTVIDETKSMLVLQTAKGRRRVPKAGSVLDLGACAGRVDGSRLLGRPHARLGAGR